MFKLASVFLLLVLQSHLSFADSVDLKINELFKANPQNQTEILSNGVKIALPVYYYQIAALVTIGTVDLDKTKALMKGTGLYPVPVSSKKGFAIIYMVDHTSNTIGNYREFVTLIAATPDQKLASVKGVHKFRSYKRILSAFFPSVGDRRERHNEEFFFYVPFITVTTPDAMLAGREIWNLPKQIAEFDLNFDGHQNSALMKSPGCNMELYQSSHHAPVKLPLYMDFNLVGFWNQDYSKIVKAPMLAKGTGYVSFFNNEHGDKFYADPNTECGQWIVQAGFKPQAWQYVPRSGAVLFGNTMQIHRPNEFHSLAVDRDYSGEQFAEELARMTE